MQHLPIAKDLYNTGNFSDTTEQIHLYKYLVLTHQSHIATCIK